MGAGLVFFFVSKKIAAENSTLEIDANISLTATIEILKDIAIGSGPRDAMLALGYAGWAPGQLEAEIQANGWLHCAARPDLVFDQNLPAKYDRALALLGVDASRLSGVAGHA